MTQALTLVPIQDFPASPPDDLRFDYTQFHSADADALERHADSILEAAQSVKKATADGMMKIGKELTEAKRRLSRHGTGTFGRWCKERCGISRTTAHRILKAYKAFGDCSTVEQTMDASAVYVLSEKSCPEEAKKEAVRQATQGKRITGKVAKELVKKCSAKTTRPKTCKTENTQVDPPPVEEARRELESVVKRWQKSVSASEMAGMLRQLADGLDSDNAEPAAEGVDGSTSTGDEEVTANTPSTSDECLAGERTPGASRSNVEACKSVRSSSPKPAAREGPQFACVTYKGTEFLGRVDGRCTFFKLKNGTASGWVGASGELEALIREAIQEISEIESNDPDENHLSRTHSVQNHQKRNQQ